MEIAIPIILLFGIFFLLMALGVPITYSIATASLISALSLLPFNASLSVITQKLTFGLDAFALLAIPFFVLAGNLMNSGGIARRLINLALSMVGWLPGSLALCNILANALFGAISGSAVASAAAVGGIMGPMQEKEKYDKGFSAAVNIASAPTGLLIPPSNVLIVYSLASGGTSIASLFVAGYIPGILMALGLMIASLLIVLIKKYPINRVPFSITLFLKSLLDAIPSLLLIIIVVGGIIKGVYTATEASAIAVVYTLILSLVFYREIKVSDLPRIFLESVVTATSVLLLVGASLGMSWVMTNADIPFLIADALESIKHNRLLLLLMMNVILLIIGTFMDITPAILIFTPIFLPFANELGVDPIQFGIIMVFNLSIGLCTPPVGSILFVGASVAGIKLEKIIGPLIPLYLVTIIVLTLVIIFPELSLYLTRFIS
ncbi:MAG: TRAP transporter large permease [Alphaproteobacteria bacterium]